MNTKLNLSVHHVGGRAATMEFPFLPRKFEEHVERVLYDADKSCIDEIKNRTKENKKIKVLPYCISDTIRKERFYLLADRYGSSLIKPGKMQKDFTTNKQFQFDFDMTNIVDRVVELDVVSLDSIYKSSQQLATPDYLSLDVEGAEKKILKGAKKLLKSNILSIKCEFHSFKLCAKLIRLCEKYGFYVSNSSLFEISFQSKNQVNIGLKGARRGSKTSGDITFLKKSSHIIKYHKSVHLDLLKIAFLAFTDAQIDKMYEYINQFMKLKGSDAFLKLYSTKIFYISFLAKFIEEFNKYPNITTMKFSTIFPTSDSRSERFTSEILIDIKKIRKRYFKKIKSKEFKESLHYLLDKNDIGIEIVCKNHGFMNYAKLFKDDRIASINGLLDLLGLRMKEDGQIFINYEELNNI